MKTFVKRFLLSSATAPRRILGGLNRGQILTVNPASQAQFYFGLYERELFPYFNRYAADIQTGLDIGAAEGSHAIYFAARTSAQRIIAIESWDKFVNLLDTHLKLNGLREKVEILPVLVNAENSLDVILGDVQGPILVKMDIEGAEIEVLRSSPKFLSLPKVRWVIETHSFQIHNDCVAILEQAGYETKRIMPAWWRKFLPEQRDPENGYLVAVQSGDISL